MCIESFSNRLQNQNFHSTYKEICVDEWMWSSKEREREKKKRGRVRGHKKSFSRWISMLESRSNRPSFRKVEFQFYSYSLWSLNSNKNQASMRGFSFFSYFFPSHPFIPYCLKYAFLATILVQLSGHDLNRWNYAKFQDLWWINFFSLPLNLLIFWEQCPNEWMDILLVREDDNDGVVLFLVKKKKRNRIDSFHSWYAGIPSQWIDDLFKS